MSNLLDNIHSPNEVKALTPEDCDRLAEELRAFIINTVAKTGGHLASNLGVIELTLALCRVFDFPRDEVVWDVGHQSYAFKILTGRREEFGTLRTWGGLSGFPKREESVYDVFNTGHSSTSVSAALGLLRGSKLLGRERKVIAVIGDGALTGGEAYEALNDAGASDEDLIVILNDNQMSIAENVGGMAAHLNKLRTSASYRHFKGSLERFCLRIPRIGQKLAEGLASLKDRFRDTIMPRDNAMLESLGFRYYGPFDGHDREQLENALRAAGENRGPVIVHVRTQKGHGYIPAESSPQNYHGVAPFEVETGIPEPPAPVYPTDMTERFEDRLDYSKNFTEAFASSLEYFGLRDEKLVGICAAMPGGTGMDVFGRRFPERFFDVGIAEQHAVTYACGLAAAGMKPVAAIYATFLQRALDQVQHDAVLQKLPVIFCLDRAGVVGEDGETHQGLYDLPYLRALPGGKIWAPSDYKDLYDMLKRALGGLNEPLFIRYPKGSTAFTREDRRKIRAFLRASGESGLSPEVSRFIRRGRDLTILAWGYTAGLAYRAAEELSAEGIECSVFDIRQIKPVDFERMKEAFGGPMLVAEEAIYPGSVAEQLSAYLFREKIDSKLKCLNIKNEFINQGKRQFVLEHYGIAVPAIKQAAKELLN